MAEDVVNFAKQNAGPDEHAPAGYDWLGRPKDPRIEALRRLGVEECDGCRGGMVRYCPIHGLKGIAPR
jgi:hypothetical protein